MQEFRDDEVVRGQELPNDAQTVLEMLSESFARLADGEIDHIRIGRFPELNEAIQVNGLRFVVIESGGETFIASIVKGKNDSADTQADGT